MAKLKPFESLKLIVLAIMSVENEKTKLQDKAEIVDAVLAALPIYNGGVMPEMLSMAETEEKAAGYDIVTG